MSKLRYRIEGPGQINNSHLVHTELDGCDEGIIVYAEYGSDCTWQVECLRCGAKGELGEKVE